MQTHNIKNKRELKNAVNFKNTYKPVDPITLVIQFTSSFSIKQDLNERQETRFY